ncbi:GNAT family N-acetyltransferase [Halomonas sp. AOP43-A1-21]
MRQPDLAAVAALANVVHLDYPEELDIYVQCFALYPGGCYVLDPGADAVAGYLIAHPDQLDEPPALNSPLEKLPETADCYFLHDLVLEKHARGRGMAGAAVERVLADASAAAFDTVALIAVGEAHAYWAGHGFAAYGSGRLDPAKGYGSEARLLVRAP